MFLEKLKPWNSSCEGKKVSSYSQPELPHAIEADSKADPRNAVGGEMEKSQALCKEVTRQ